MVFSSAIFVFAFLPILFILYTVIPGLRAKNALLIAASLVFYAFGEPLFVFVMIFSIFVNYLLARGMGLWKHRRVLLAIAVIWDIGLIGVFKYAAFFVDVINGWFGTNLQLLSVTIPAVGAVTVGSVLPIGISFFTFQILSYVIDVYRTPEIEEKSFAKVLLYVAFFPQLIAGPIVKYHDIISYINSRRQTMDEVMTGIRRFIVGLAKKLLLANAAAAVAAPVFEANPSELSVPVVWLGAVCYTLQIYLDFSGYSDMAIGMGHMFGFTIKENFDHPYIANSMRDFWKRWHISLTSWFREYLYIPLGGNRKGRVRTMVNKLIVFFCTGFWHGANWNFIVWGMIHGLSMVFEDIITRGRNKARQGFRLVGWAYTMFIVIIAFVLFNADDLGHAIGLIGRMFYGPLTSAAGRAIFAEAATPYSVVMILIAAVCCLPLAAGLRRFVQKRNLQRTAHTLSYAGSIVLLFLCVMNLAGASYNPFIYFRF